MLIRTSAPQPATRTTPTGGTGMCVLALGVRVAGTRRALTEEGDEDGQNDADGAGHVFGRWSVGVSGVC